MSYFDHNATTPVDPRVREAMMPWLGERYGNPSSIHAFGRAAAEAVEAARQEVAALLEGARGPEIVFAASGTEANNAVLQSAVGQGEGSGHLVVSAVEHPSVARVAAAFADIGLEVSWILPDRQGRIDPDRMVAALRPDTRLVALMLANNIVGTLQPVTEVARLCRQRGVPVLCDAVQAVGKIPVDVGELGVDYLTLGAHKFNGPLGAAALWLRAGAAYSPLLLGGAQERRRRAGTVNVPAVVGLGEAARLARREMAQRTYRVTALRNRFESCLGRISDVVVYGAGTDRLPNTSQVGFAGVDSQSLIIRLDLAGFAVSAGSACSSGTVEPSDTLLAMGVSPQDALSALRVSFGHGNTESEVEALLTALSDEVANLRRFVAGSAS